ncbi:MAG: hypothetical protein KIA07_03310 [Finegoldia magna]|uniref:Uncharacterized protein n=1 Tax=Finegoldia magna TaxID=1260 RepID=A0A943LEL6_FINMA|nr:hypothetical protein [Finegoldia magna]MBS5964678.1 hypothetical protein [Finegoldia magna]
MSKIIRKNLIGSLFVNVTMIIALSLLKEKLEVISFMLIVISPVLLSVIMCYFLNKGYNINQKDKAKINVLYFSMNFIFYVFLFIILRDGTIINDIVLKAQTLQTEYITVSKNSNFSLSFVIFLILSYVGHKLVLDRIREK